MCQEEQWRTKSGWQEPWEPGGARRTRKSQSPVVRRRSSVVDRRPSVDQDPWAQTPCKAQVINLGGSASLG